MMFWIKSDDGEERCIGDKLEAYKHIEAHDSTLKKDLMFWWLESAYQSFNELADAVIGGELTNYPEDGLLWALGTLKDWTEIDRYFGKDDWLFDRIQWRIE